MQRSLSSAAKSNPRSQVRSFRTIHMLATYSHFTDDHRVLIDLSDWEDSSDEEIEDGEEATSTTGGTHPILSDPIAACSRGSQVVKAETHPPVRRQFPDALGMF